MPLDRPLFHLARKTPPGGPAGQRLTARVAELNAQLGESRAERILETALKEISPLALVSSFGAESIALLHLASRIDRLLPVLFIDTELLFPETLRYQREVAQLLGLRNLRVIRSDRIETQDPAGALHLEDPDACCRLRKVEPLDKALTGFNGWITGRKRFQAGSRAHLNAFEHDPGSGRIKVNPLANWSAADAASYIAAHRLPVHPMVEKGYPSIGCAPCTTPVVAGEDPRAGRWRNRTKVECGIHFSDVGIIREGDMA